jgi:hypothetical protein
MGDDDISLWDHEDIEGREPGYRDEFSSEEDVFDSGNVDDDAMGKTKR